MNPVSLSLCVIPFLSLMVSATGYPPLFSPPPVRPPTLSTAFTPKSKFLAPGKLIFFFQFLQAGGRWEKFLRDCPLHYTGNRGSGTLNLMVTSDATRVSKPP
jgi:hypothetical protein